MFYYFNKLLIYCTSFCSCTSFAAYTNILLYFQGSALGSLSDIDDLATTFSKV